MKTTLESSFFLCVFWMVMLKVFKHHFKDNRAILIYELPQSIIQIWKCNCDGAEKVIGLFHAVQRKPSCPCGRSHPKEIGARPGRGTEKCSYSFLRQRRQRAPGPWRRAGIRIQRHLSTLRPLGPRLCSACHLRWAPPAHLSLFWTNAAPQARCSWVHTDAGHL